MSQEPAGLLASLFILTPLLRCSAMLAKLGLDARVSIIDAEMVGLDRASRLLELSDGSQLPFDVLLVTCGLQVSGLAVHHHEWRVSFKCS